MYDERTEFNSDIRAVASQKAASYEIALSGNENVRTQSSTNVAVGNGCAVGDIYEAVRGEHNSAPAEVSC